jgi:hypothetical protein
MTDEYIKDNETKVMTLNKENRAVEYSLSQFPFQAFYTCNIKIPDLERQVHNQGDYIKKEGLIKAIESIKTTKDTNPKYSSTESLFYCDTWHAWGFNDISLIDDEKYKFAVEKKAGNIWTGIHPLGDAVVLSMFLSKQKCNEERVHSVANQILDKLVEYTENAANYDLNRSLYDNNV